MKIPVACAVVMLGILVWGLSGGAAADALSRDRTAFSLLREAQAQGQMDYETALVDQVLSIFETGYMEKKFGTESLQPDKCATPLFMEIRNNWTELSPAVQQRLLPYLLRPTESGTVEPYGHAYTVTPQSLATPGGHFRIWYVPTTADAPAMTDVNPADGVPDWVNRCGEICDEVWTAEVDVLGFQAPPQDGSWYPSGQDYGGDSRYDVHIEDLGQSIFGYTQSEYALSGTRSATSYIVIDNDYAWYPNYNPGRIPLDAMRVTLAHEFHHAIHFGYDALDTGDRWWMEISSVWMEDQVYDAVDDYLAYLPSFFNDPSISLDHFNGLHEYGSGIWAMFLDQEFGADIMPSIWGYCVSMTALNAMDKALADRGSSLAEAFRTFTVWNYFTGSRANPDLYYEEGADYPMLSFNNRHIQYPASGQGSIDHLAASYIGFIPGKGMPGGLAISLQGATQATWKATALEFQSAAAHSVFEVILDSQALGAHGVRNWGVYSEIVLIPGVVSRTGSNWSCSYTGTYDQSLGASIVLSETNHDFGGVLLGQEKEWWLNIFNQGTEERRIDSVTVTGREFRIADGLLFPQVIAASESLMVSVTFRPEELGGYSEQLIVASDDSLRPTSVCQLSGLGTTSTALRQNFPNPFRVAEHGKTYFPLQLSDAVRQATIVIMTPSGEVVRRLKLHNLEAEGGLYATPEKIELLGGSWDGTNEQGSQVGSGIYLYTLQAGDFVETRKIAVIR